MGYVYHDSPRSDSDMDDIYSTPRHALNTPHSNSPDARHSQTFDEDEDPRSPLSVSSSQSVYPPQSTSKMKSISKSESQTNLTSTNSTSSSSFQSPLPQTPQSTSDTHKVARKRVRADKSDQPQATQGK